MYLEKLRKIREQQRLSQKELGELIGLDQSAYCKIEKGIHYLSVPTLLNLCNVLNVSVNEILNQNSLEKNIPLSYTKEKCQAKLELYDNAINELELLVNAKNEELKQLRQSREELLIQAQGILSNI